MHEGNGNRSLSHRRSHAFDVAGTDITDGEDSRQACFEEIWGASQWPVRRREIFARQVRARLDEALGIECDTAMEPVRIWCRAGHDEDMADVMCFDVPRLTVSPVHTLQMIRSFERRDFCVSKQ